MDFGTLYIVLFAIVAYAMNVIDAKDYYEILGVSRSATDRQIKKAFHKLAAKYHPDKNKEIGAEDQFREIAQAYEILSNSENRKKYDKYGDAAFNGGGRGGHHFNNFNFNDFFKHFDDFGGGGEEGGSRFGNDRNGFKFSFGGNGGGGGMFDDFFDGDDDWSDFDSFGNQDTFFGHFGHHHSHHSSHHSGHSEGGVYRSSESRSHAEGGRTCKTVTQRVGNMVTTYTQCS